MKYLITKLALWFLWRRAQEIDRIAAKQIGGLPDNPKYDSAADMIESAAVDLQNKLRYVQKALLA